MEREGATCTYCKDPGSAMVVRLPMGVLECSLCHIRECKDCGEHIMNVATKTRCDRHAAERAAKKNRKYNRRYKRKMADTYQRILREEREAEKRAQEAQVESVREKVRENLEADSGRRNKNEYYERLAQETDDARG